MTALSIVVVSHNAREELARCLESVYASRGLGEFEVIVPDNASQDESASMVAEQFPQARVLPLDDNFGFSKASNLGWRAARGRFVLFLNSDTLVPPDALAALIEKLDSRPEVGALGPKLLNSDGSLQMSHGRMMSLGAELRQKLLNAGYRGGSGPLRGVVDRLHARERAVDWVSGACLLVRHELLEVVAGFDEAFFLYAEDVDLCARLRARGAVILFTPDVEVTHHGGRSTRRDRERAFVESQRSRLHFYAKHHGQPQLALLKLYLTIRLGCAYVVRPSARRAYRTVLDRLFHGAPSA